MSSATPERGSSPPKRIASHRGLLLRQPSRTNPGSPVAEGLRTGTPGGSRVGKDRDADASVKERTPHQAVEAGAATSRGRLHLRRRKEACQ